MDFNDEKDYIMRIIKEMVRVLFSLMLGKQYKSVELPEENKYEVSGKALEEFEKMVDAGLINEPENVLVELVGQPKPLLAIRLFSLGVIIAAATIGRIVGVFMQKRKGNGFDKR